MKKIALFTCILIVIGTMFGCSDKETKKNPVKKPVKQVVKEEVKPTFKYQYPLSGVATNDDVNGRSVAVMVSNAPEARPQSGLDKADIVFEYYAESTITRFLAIYQSEIPEKIGPVRSARDYFVHTAKLYNSFYVAHGYSDSARKLLQSGYIDNINGMAYDGVYFHRDKNRVAPHNSYTSSTEIKNAADKLGKSLTGAPGAYQFYTENEMATITGATANEVTVKFGGADFNVTYKYDPTLKKYTRYVKDVQWVDKDSGAPIQIDNLFIVEMKNTIAADKLRVINIETGGRAYLIQNGMMTECTWENRDGAIRPMLNGQELKLIPGHTWISSIPTDSLSKMVVLQ